jgi:hypothetical protein
LGWRYYILYAGSNREDPIENATHMYFKLFNEGSSPEKRNQVQNFVLIFIGKEKQYLRMPELRKHARAV